MILIGSCEYIIQFSKLVKVKLLSTIPIPTTASSCYLLPVRVATEVWTVLTVRWAGHDV